MKTGNEKQLLDSLFCNYGTGTVSLIILKTTKNTVRVEYAGTFFTLNKHGVLTCESLLPDGKTWYTFCPSCYPEKEIISSIKEWLQENPNKYEFAYKL